MDQPYYKYEKDRKKGRLNDVLSTHTQFGLGWEAREVLDKQMSSGISNDRRKNIVKRKY